MRRRWGRLRWGACLAASCLAIGWQTPVATESPTPTAERVLVDLRVVSLPLEADWECVLLPPGQLAATLYLDEELAPRRAGDPPRSAVFLWEGYRGADAGAQLRLDVLPTPQTRTVPLAGGRYCFLFQNTTRIAMDAPASVVDEAVVIIAARLTWSPPP